MGNMSIDGAGLEGFSGWLSEGGSILAGGMAHLGFGELKNLMVFISCQDRVRRHECGIDLYCINMGNYYWIIRDAFWLIPVST